MVHLVRIPEAWMRGPSGYPRLKGYHSSLHAHVHSSKTVRSTPPCMSHTLQGDRRAVGSLACLELTCTQTSQLWLLLQIGRAPVFDDHVWCGFHPSSNVRQVHTTSRAVSTQSLLVPCISGSLLCKACHTRGCVPGKVLSCQRGATQICLT